jgi:hypothetical protein
VAVISGLGMPSLWEGVILKAHHDMNRCWLKGSKGDALRTVLCAVSFNLHWVLRTVARLCLGFVLLVIAALTSAASVQQDLHRRITGTGNRMLLTGGHQVTVEAGS